MDKAHSAQSGRAADYVVVRAGQVVQEISALGAVNAKAAVTEPGTLYAKVGQDGDSAREVQAFIEEALR